MSQDRAEQGESGEPVGTIAEEAAKLFAALGIGREHESHRQAVDGVCRFCPLCRAASRLGLDDPEVRSHLASAATSLMQAGAAMLEAYAGQPSGSGAARNETDDEPGADPTGRGDV